MIAEKGTMSFPNLNIEVKYVVVNLDKCKLDEFYKFNKNGKDSKIPEIYKFRFTNDYEVEIVKNELYEMTKNQPL